MVMSKKINFIFNFFFHSEFKGGCYVIKYSKYFGYCLVIVNYKDVIYMAKISNYMTVQ